MKSVGFTLKLRPGCYDEYKRRHDELWPELADALREYGISLVVYRHGDTLFVYEQAPDEVSFTKMAAHPVAPRWNKYMADIVETDERGNIIFQPLTLAFSFGALKE